MNLNEWMKMSWMRGQQTYPLTIYFNMWTVSSDVSIKAPLTASLNPFMSLLYTPNPRCEWCGVCRLTTPPGSTSPPLFEQWCGFFYVPREPDKCTEVLWDGTYGFSSLSEKTRKSNRGLTICRCHYKGSMHFLLSYLKTLSVDPAGVRTHDLPLSRLALSQLSQPGGGFDAGQSGVSNQVVVTRIQRQHIGNLRSGSIFVSLITK